jgi:predicted TPR repeat methyltransferase
LPALSPVADLVTAADVFMYVGELGRLFSRIAELLLPSGHFAFSVELNDGPEELVLRPSRRYAHSRGYVERLLAEKGFALVSRTVATIRMDRGEPVIGLVMVAKRVEDPNGMRPFAPPSVLPDISPSRGEIKLAASAGPPF